MALDTTSAEWVKLPRGEGGGSPHRSHQAVLKNPALRHPVREKTASSFGAMCSYREDRLCKRSRGRSRFLPDSSLRSSLCGLERSLPKVAGPSGFDVFGGFVPFAEIPEQAVVIQRDSISCEANEEAVQLVAKRI